MSRTEFIIATTIVLFLAFLLGVLAHWMASRLRRPPPGDGAEIDRLAGDLQEVEEGRDRAIAYFQEREADMLAQLSQTEAELAAAMDGLRAARNEADELRDYLNRLRPVSDQAR